VILKLLVLPGVGGELEVAAVFGGRRVKLTEV
jgi:hypothetical protein